MGRQDAQKAVGIDLIDLLRTLVNSLYKPATTGYGLIGFLLFLTLSVQIVSFYHSVHSPLFSKLLIIDRRAPARAAESSAQLRS